MTQSKRTKVMAEAIQFHMRVDPSRIESVFKTVLAVPCHKLVVLLTHHYSLTDTFDEGAKGRTTAYNILHGLNQLLPREVDVRQLAVTRYALTATREYLDYCHRDYKALAEGNGTDYREVEILIFKLHGMIKPLEDLAQTLVFSLKDEAVDRQNPMFFSSWLASAADAADAAETHINKKGMGQEYWGETIYREVLKAL